MYCSSFHFCQFHVLAIIQTLWSIKGWPLNSLICSKNNKIKILCYWILRFKIHFHLLSLARFVNLTWIIFLNFSDDSWIQRSTPHYQREHIMCMIPSEIWSSICVCSHMISSEFWSSICICLCDTHTNVHVELRLV